MREQGVVLEHRVDRSLMRRQVRDLIPIKEDRPFGDVLETGDHAQQSSLATARRAQKGEEFIVLDGQRNPLQRCEIAIAFHSVADVDCIGDAGSRVGFPEAIGIASYIVWHWAPPGFAISTKVTDRQIAMQCPQRDTRTVRPAVCRCWCFVGGLGPPSRGLFLSNHRKRPAGD